MLEFSNDDAIAFLRTLPDACVDAVITDPPYGTTDQAWDVVIPFEPLWAELKRVRKDRAPVVLFGAQPFTSLLITSNPKEFRYAWVWEKNVAGGFAQAKNKPMPIHEDIIVFSSGRTGHASQCKNRMPYYPQGLIPYGKEMRNNVGDYPSAFEARANRAATYFQEWTNYPNSVLNFDVERTGLHPNQKPVALMEYLIRTYTRPGEVVLDFTMGSGSTGVAAVQNGRGFIGNERDFGFYAAARKRIINARQDARAWLADLKEVLNEAPH